MTGAKRRNAVRFLHGRGLSVQRACQLVRLHRSIYQYQARPDQNTDLLSRLQQLAQQHPRYGYRRICALLRREQQVNSGGWLPPTPRQGRLVGRRRELAQLQQLWTQTQDGLGQLALVFGEPGIGKTRLAHALIAYAQQQGATVLRGGCYEYEATTPYCRLSRGYALMLALTAPTRVALNSAQRPRNSLVLRLRLR